MAYGNKAVRLGDKFQAAAWPQSLVVHVQAIGAQMDKQHDQLAQIIDAQKDNHEWLVSLTQKVNDHDSQLSAIQESLHISAGKQDANAIRTKNIQHTLDSE